MHRTVAHTSVRTARERLESVSLRMEVSAVFQDLMDGNVLPLGPYKRNLGRMFEIGVEIDALFGIGIPPLGATVCPNVMSVIQGVLGCEQYDGHR